MIKGCYEVSPVQCKTITKAIGVLEEHSKSKRNGNNPYSSAQSHFVVRFLGVYSTPTHPFALVFEFMDHLNLREYLSNNCGVRRLDLVCYYSGLQFDSNVSKKTHSRFFVYMWSSASRHAPQFATSGTVVTSHEIAAP